MQGSAHHWFFYEEPTMSDTREWVMQWVRDAHAMEEQAVTMLTGQEGRLANYPELRAAVSRRIKETQDQGRRLRMYLESRNDSSSILKDLGGKTIALGQSLSGLFAGDEVMKGLLASYTFEHMEIASYRILKEAARSIDDAELEGICDQNLQEELATARWLEEHIPALTIQFLARSETDSDAAKR
jgi:ferritin-like metal-binding protein YciE